MIYGHGLPDRKNDEKQYSKGNFDDDETRMARMMMMISFSFICVHILLWLGRHYQYSMNRLNGNDYVILRVSNVLFFCGRRILMVLK